MHNFQLIQQLRCGFKRSLLNHINGLGSRHNLPHDTDQIAEFTQSDAENNGHQL